MLVKQGNRRLSQIKSGRNLTGLADLVGFEAIPTRFGRNLPGFKNLLGFSGKNKTFFLKIIIIIID